MNRQLSNPLCRTLILAAITAVSTPAIAEYENRSFSVFGAAGMQYINYSEELNDYYGVDMKSSFEAVNFVQRSGGYTAVNEKLGFSIISASTLLSFENDEDWEMQGQNGYVQHNTTSLSFQTLDMMMSYHFQNGWYTSAGMHYQKTAFSRFDWSTGSANDAYNSTIENSIRDNPAMMEVVQQYIDQVDSISSEDEYFAAIKNEPEANQTVVFEDASNFGVMVGIAYDSYFMNQSSGMRYQFSLEVGTPVYEKILNSSHSGSLDRTFGGGLDVTGKLGIGYQFSRKLSTMLLFTGLYSHRDKLQEWSNALDSVTLPENTLYAAASYLSLGWNFK
ncbi:hypothetical protein [Oceanobacter sp. 4_MG-2023]|uniref:hypothetical protein n=1 Tax=Oceanobacter sp. 4_MG-2023 TaxID=3062623 RepID=UPI002734A75A|nr:hypothetical protein [Oceanobacter sp. 4_MG-2023]MDP2547492.1 hypothetical protein [Oceanobacter sp. 4_MG-2023]